MLISKNRDDRIFIARIASVFISAFFVKFKKLKFNKVHEMGTRKCCINGCTSQEGEDKDAGVTFHRFPHNSVHVEKWIKGKQASFHNFLQYFLISVFRLQLVN